MGQLALTECLTVSVFLLHPAAKRVFWEEPKKATVNGCKLTYDGTPIFIKRLVILQCQHGKDKHAGRKKKQARKRANAKEVQTSFVCRDTGPTKF